MNVSPKPNASNLRLPLRENSGEASPFRNFGGSDGAPALGELIITDFRQQPLRLRQSPPNETRRYSESNANHHPDGAPTH